jgi:DNA-binding Xre family transcriptional regulator
MSSIKVLEVQKLKISDVSKAIGINRRTLTKMDQKTLVRIDLEIINILYEYLSVSLDGLLEYQKSEKSA